MDKATLSKLQSTFSIHIGIPVQNILDLNQLFDSHYQQKDTTKRTGTLASAFTRPHFF